MNQSDIDLFQDVWVRLRRTGAEDRLFAALRTSIIGGLNNVKTPDDAYRVALQYQLVSDLQMTINNELNLLEGTN